MSTSWPQPLEPATGPIPADRIDGVAAGMGTAGPITADLIADGWLPPDLLCSMGLFILARQPRPERDEVPGRPRKASAITGSVWVREQCTIHDPVTRTERFHIEGENLSRFVRKGRRYMSSIARTTGADGRPVATNVTTGLTSYRPVDGLEDSHEGVPVDAVDVPGPDRTAASSNPHLEVIRRARTGDAFEAGPTTVTLAMMAARDTANSDNPIHSDPEQARAAGLDRPIAGGNHVLSFALEPALRAWGPQALFHGAHIDTQWKAPTKADDVIGVLGQVTEASSDAVTAMITVHLLDNDNRPAATAMETTIVVPLPVS